MATTSGAESWASGGYAQHGHLLNNNATFLCSHPSLSFFLFISFSSFFQELEDDTPWLPWHK
eukprot:1160033-Pelagomonas_calceolata.AAC.2